ncbi:MAG: nucleotidyltransferase domain-containing protein [Bacteroidales bacterium]|nr:nucleotidyltransferase domain-containing protein [Bacteroidales bacterium]MDY6394595.1 nucleotidyltransferase domain-containing protein [Bacteroidales bacterium]
MLLIEQNIDRIKQLCNAHDVLQMSVFGSILTEHFDEQSDIDILVSFDSIPLENYADNYLQLQVELQNLLGREVDLVEDKAIRNPVFRENIDRTKVQIYGRV